MKTIVILIAIAALAETARAQNFSGHWTFEAPGMGGQVQKISLDLNQNGNVVTGTLSARLDLVSASPVNNAIWWGKVEGNTITFYVWRGSDRPWKQSYKGTLSGDQIMFTVTDAPHLILSFSGPPSGGTGSTTTPIP